MLRTVWEFVLIWKWLKESDLKLILKLKRVMETKDVHKQEDETEAARQKQGGKQFTENK